MYLSLGTHCLFNRSPNAFKWVLRAHIRGNTLATAVLGLIFEFGINVPVSFKTAER